MHKLSVTALATAIVIVGLSSGVGSARTRLKPITMLTPGSGLQGGGTGPTTSLQVANDGVKSSHIANGTLVIEDFSLAA